MNIHEYQARLFAKYGVPVPQNIRPSRRISSTPLQLPEGPTMVKSQIHAGGRSRARSRRLQGRREILQDQGRGPRDRREDARQHAGHDPDRAGRTQTIYFTVASEIKGILPRHPARPRLVAAGVVASTEGGVEIEKVAHDTPENFSRSSSIPAYGLADFQVRG